MKFIEIEILKKIVLNFFNIKRTSGHSLQGVLILKFHFKNLNFNNY